MTTTMSKPADYISQMGANLCWSGNHYHQLHAAADNGCDLAAAVLFWQHLTTHRGRRSDQENFNAACAAYRAAMTIEGR